MNPQNVPYEKQIFVCTNNAHGEKASCGDHQGEEVFRRLRQIAKDEGVHPRIRVAQAKCLGQCARGVNIMVYPDNTWHSGMSVDDVEHFAEKYLRTKGEKA